MDVKDSICYCKISIIRDQTYVYIQIKLNDINIYEYKTVLRMVDAVLDAYIRLLKEVEKSKILNIQFHIPKNDHIEKYIYKDTPLKHVDNRLFTELRKQKTDRKISASFKQMNQKNRNSFKKISDKYPTYLPIFPVIDQKKEYIKGLFD